MTVGTHFVIHIQIPVSITDNKNAFTLWNPCNTSAPAAITASSKVIVELIANSHVFSTSIYMYIHNPTTYVQIFALDAD